MHTQLLIDSIRDVRNIPNMVHLGIETKKNNAFRFIFLIA